MITISQAVREIIREDPFLYQVLSQKIANLHQVAKKIQPQVEKITYKTVKIQSVVMALVRLTKTLEEKNLTQLIRQNLYNLQIKTPIFEIVLEKNQENLQKLEKIFGKKDSLLGVIIGDKEINLVGNKKVKDKIIDNFSVKKIFENLASLAIFFNEKLVETPGLLSFLTNLFYINNINIIEVISTYTEINIIIHYHDLQKAVVILGNQLQLK